MTSWTFYPLPEEPHQFKAKFYLSYYDDDGNQTASHPYSHTVELETEILPHPQGAKSGGDKMRLFGKASHFTHQSFILPVDNHPNGLSFSVGCRNRHKAVLDQGMWRAYLNSKQVHALFKEETPTELTITGDFWQVPNSATADLKVTLRHIRGTGHVIDTVALEFPVAQYRKFFHRIKD